MRFKILLTGLVLSAISCSEQNSKNFTVDFNQNSKPREFFANKVTAAQKDGKWGWINLFGEWVIPAEYDERPSDWEGGLCMVKKNGLYGIINTKNKAVLPIKYEQPVWVHSAKNTVGHITYLSTKRDGQVIFFNKEGEIIDTVPEPLVMHNTLCIPKETGRYDLEVDSKVVNHKGETLLEFNKDPFICWVGQFHNDLAPFFIASFRGGSASLAGGLTYYGYINEKGELIVPVQFVANHLNMIWSDWGSDHRMKFEDGQALVKGEKQYSLINERGEAVKEFPDTFSWIDTAITFGLRETSLGWINKNGDLIYETEGSDWQFVAKGFNPNGYAIMRNGKQKRFKVVNHKMEEIYSQPYFDDEFTYWIFPVNDTLFGLRRGSNQMFKKKGMDHYTATNSGLGEMKYFKYTGGETDWMKMEPKGKVPDIGLIISEPEGEIMKTTIANTESQVIFECDSCTIRYFGNDQYNNRGKWALEVRYANRRIEPIGLNGFRYLEHTDYFENKFMDLDKGVIDPSKDYQNFDFTLKFDEDKVREIYKDLFPEQ